MAEGRDGRSISRDADGKIILPSRGWSPPPDVGTEWDVELRELERCCIASPTRQILRVETAWAAGDSCIVVQTWSGRRMIQEERVPIDRVVISRVDPPTDGWVIRGLLVARLCGAGYVHTHSTEYVPSRTERDIGAMRPSGDAAATLRTIYDRESVEASFVRACPPGVRIDWECPSTFRSVRSENCTMCVTDTPEWREMFGDPPTDLGSLVAFVARNGERCALGETPLFDVDGSPWDDAPCIGCYIPQSAGIELTVYSYDPEYHGLACADHDDVHVIVLASGGADHDVEYCALVRREDAPGSVSELEAAVAAVMEGWGFFRG